MDQLALDLYLAALCAIGFLAWIARDVTANIVGHIGKPAGRQSGGLRNPRS
jgi:hypothetical protein